MAEKKGQHGGARAGAGRKPKPPDTVNVEVPESIAKLAHSDPKVFLFALMNDLAADVKIRADAAKALMPYIHHKVGEIGKKEERANAAKKASGGKFAASAPPKLVVNNR